MVHSEAATRFDDITKNQTLNIWISWVNAQILSFPFSREKVMVEPGTAISISIQFGRLFCFWHAFHLASFFYIQGLILNILHDLLSMVSVRPSVRKLH